MIYAEHLRKEFKKNIKEPGLKGSFKALFKPQKEIVVAAEDVSFHVPKGEILGFIGPNGAGKSTVIKMLTGILTPTSGQCRINGRDPLADRKTYVREIGAVFGQRTQLWWDLPLRETYSVLKEIYEVEDDVFKKRMAFLNEVLELEKFITSPVRTLSLGQRMRADIAASMLHCPKVLFLDEPTIGLDVVVKDHIRQAIMKLNKEEKTTVILTTHDISDIELLCDRIVMIDKGINVYDGSLRTLRENYGQMRELVFEAAAGSSLSEEEFCKGLPVSGDDLQIEKDKQVFRVHFNSRLVPVGEMLRHTLSLTKVKDISVKDADIEQIIRNLYQEGGKTDG